MNFSRNRLVAYEYIDKVSKSTATLLFLLSLANTGMLLQSATEI